MFSDIIPDVVKENYFLNIYEYDNTIKNICLNNFKNEFDVKIKSLLMDEKTIFFQKMIENVKIIVDLEKQEIKNLFILEKQKIEEDLNKILIEQKKSMKNQLNQLKENLESEYVEKTNIFFNNEFLIKRLKYKELKIRDIEKREELKKLKEEIIYLKNQIIEIKQENNTQKINQEKQIFSFEKNNEEIILFKKNNEQIQENLIFLKKSLNKKNTDEINTFLINTKQELEEQFCTIRFLKSHVEKDFKDLQELKNRLTTLEMEVSTNTNQRMPNKNIYPLDHPYNNPINYVLLEIKEIKHSLEETIVNKKK